MEDLGLFLDLAVNHDAYGVMSIDTTKDFVLDLEQLDEAGYFKNTDDVLIGMNRSFFNLQPQYIPLCLKSLKQGIEIPLALTYYNAKQFLKIYVFSTKKQSTLFV